MSYSPNQPPPDPQPAGALRVATIIVTNLIKLAGLVVAMNEIIVHGNAIRGEVIALAAFMMSGAQFSERALLAALDRFVGQPPPPSPPPVAPAPPPAPREDAVP